MTLGISLTDCINKIFVKVYRDTSCNISFIKEGVYQ